MRSGEVQGVVQLLKTLSKFEMGLFEFYRKAMDYWGPDGEFLVNFIQQEVLHAENLSQMADIVSKNPERFERGRPVDPHSLAAAVNGLKSNLARLQREDVRKQEILSISREMENWLVGFRYTELLRSKDPVYQKLVKEIAFQTEGHKRLLDKKVEEMKRPRPAAVGATPRLMMAE